MKTAKSMGYKKGDLVYTGAFPGIIISDVNSATPCCEVWGYEQECGSVYASDLRRLTPEEFRQLILANGHKFPLAPYSKVSIEALNALVVAA